MLDCIIIGAGPAGMTSAIYLKRKNLDVLVIDKSTPGGQMLTTASIENYPGYEHISGADLASNMYMQVIGLGVKIKKDEALKIERVDTHYLITTTKTTYEAKSIILALGLVPKRLGFSNENEFIGKGISFCAICDGSLYKGKDVVVTGGGNSALEESLYLSSICNKVYLVHRRDEFRADELLVDKIRNKDNVELVLKDTIKQISKASDNGIEEIELESGKKISASALFEFVGNKPSTEFLNDLNILDDNGFVIVDNNYETRHEYIYAIGDCINKKYRQIASAVGDACVASLNLASRIGE